MLNLIFTVISWTLVLILIPFLRLRTTWLVGVISPILLFIIDFTFVKLGYYQFPNKLVDVFGIPLFYLLGGSAGGILFTNWLPRKPLLKIISVLGFSGLLLVTERVFYNFGAFKYLYFTPLLSYTLNVAGLSILTLLALGTIGEEKIYNGPKSRFGFLK